MKRKLSCLDRGIPRVLGFVLTTWRTYVLWKAAPMELLLESTIGEKGMGLSGGQKQRVAIARAILNNPRILIFDEATSALDYESESIIQNNLKEICKGRTVLIIAHRLSTLKDAQKIMVIDKGSLVEYDTHENLMTVNGLYAYLYNQQQRGDVNG